MSSAVKTSAGARPDEHDSDAPRLGIAPVATHGPLLRDRGRLLPAVTRYAVRAQGGAPHTFTAGCGVGVPQPTCPECADAVVGSLRGRIEAGRVGQ